MDRPCPICKRQLSSEQKTEYVEYHCFPPQSDHHYACRTSLEGQALKVKIRIGSGDNKMFVKINYDDGFSQIWTDPDDEDARTKINHVFDPDLSDLDALRNKLRTYLVFS